jgi:ubiquinone/menaquinone biosynthesis C-methylase UbiE
MLGLARRIVRQLPRLRPRAPLASEANRVALVPDKYSAEASFWRMEIAEYVVWYSGEATLYGVAPPNLDQKITGLGQPLDAIETWLNLHQLPKYPSNLFLRPDALIGLRVLDIGCGPFPGLRAFSDCATRVGVDPLVATYEEIGFPLGRWSHGYIYCQTRAESLPFPSRSFDAVLSCNAIDHVDDFAMVAKEVQRVLKPGGKLCMQVHYHRRTITEPLELNDQTFVAHYGWVRGLHKAKDADSTNNEATVAGPGERYVVWSNMGHEA